MQLIEGDITLLTVKKYLTDLLTVAIDSPINLDFSKVERIDSSLLSYVLHIIRYAKRMGQTVYLANLPVNFTELAKLYGIDELLQPYLQQKL